ncbi:Prophage-tail domain-containing protein [Fusobacterium necrophorum subsp. funduliforme]
MQLSTLRYQGYTARITNLSTMEELQDWVSECNITLPQSNLISSMEARFQLEEKKINKGNEIKIEILDDVGNVLYTLQGEANIPRRTKSYTGLEVWEYTVKDSYNRLFEKVVPESQTFYDLYLCNTNDKHNSLLHKIASALGFREEELDFESVAFENGSLIRLPFVYLEENSRWIDKLQAFIEASDGILYVKNKKLFYRPRNLTINHAFSFNRTNIITSLEEIEKEVLQNGIRLVYDRYEKLDNQVVFNLQKKIITEPNTNPDTEVPTMRISFITSAVSNPILTKATGYYFKTDDPSSKVDIPLEENVHYKKVSWKETGAEVKFYNPLPYKLYVDNFEIKGVPLSMYSDNEVSVMYPNVLEKHQENFITSSKNKFVQTSEQAKFLAKKAMRRGIVNHAEYQFKTPFLHQIEVGGVYGLDLEDIHTTIEITNISINLRPGVFRMDIQGISVEEELGSVKITSKLSGNPKESYIDLSSVKKEIQETKEELSHKYKEEILSLSEKYDKELSKVTEKLGELTQGIQDNKVKIHTIKPSHNTLTDLNVGDMYISDTSVEILIKEGNEYIWKPLKDSETKKALEQYIQETNSKLVTVSYQEKAPKSPNVGDIWIDTKNDGVWKRWNGSKWEQVDTSVRNALKRANKDIQKIETTLEEVNNTVKYKIFAKAFVQEETPYHGIKEHDVWYNPKTNVYKVWFNNRWNNASEEDIFPALRHYVSLQNATLEIGKKAEQANQRAGIFLTNNDQAFGSKYGELAEVSIDKQGSIRLKNANNLLEWNVKDPQNSYKMKSRFYMGVTDVDRIPDDVYFKVGDETNGFSIELKEGSSKAKINGKELEQKFHEIDGSVAKIDNQLEKGNFVVTGNTIFDGTASITSKGTNERIEMTGGSLDFYRMVDGKEVRLSQIRNQQSGTIATDGKGSGILELKGWRTPIVMTQSIRSVNVGHGLASIWCYHEMIKSDPPTYKFFLGSTTEKVQFNNPVSTEQLSETIRNVTSINVQSSKVKIPTSDIYFSVEEDKLQEGIKNMNAKIFCVSRVSGKSTQGLTYYSNKASEMCSYEELQEFCRARFSKENWMLELVFDDYHYKVNRQIETEILTFTEQEFLRSMKQSGGYKGVTFQYYLRVRIGEEVLNLHRGGYAIKKLEVSKYNYFGYFTPVIVTPNPNIQLPAPFTKTFSEKKTVTIEHVCDSQCNVYLSDLNNLVYTVKRVGGPKGKYTLEEVTFDNTRPQWIFYGFDGRQLLFNRNITYTYTSKEIQELEGYGEVNYTAFEID